MRESTAGHVPSESAVTFVGIGNIEQGRQQGKAELLLRLVERKFGPADAQLRQQIQEADAETLLEWSDRILTAETPEAVFH